MAKAKAQPKVQVLAWMDPMLAEELRRYVEDYRRLAKRAHVTSPVTLSSVIRDAVDREMTRRKERAQLRHPMPKAMLRDAAAGRRFLELVQLSLRAVDLSVNVHLAKDVLAVECPAFCQEAVEQCLPDVCSQAVEDAGDQGDWSRP